MARQGLILCQHRPTACKDLLGAYLAQYPLILNSFLSEMLYVEVSGVSRVKNQAEQPTNPLTGQDYILG